MIQTATPTPLLDLPALARLAGVARVMVKDEGRRLLGNFKSLGGLTAGLKALDRAGPGAMRRLICASDGNHGLAVAEAARRARAQARIYLPAHVDEARVRRIAALGAEIVRIDDTYDQAVSAAEEAAQRGEGLLIPDTSQEPDDPVVRDVMDGYTVMTDELAEQFATLGAPPTHAFTQAGVGGLAAAVAQGLARSLAAPPRMVVAEPRQASCVGAALAAGRPVQLTGALETCAEMLSCGLASAPALKVLLAYNADWVGVDEEGLLAAPGILREAGGPATTPSGATGLAGLLAADMDTRRLLDIGPDSRVLLIVSEAALASGAA